MRKLVVVADPIHGAEIFEVFEDTSQGSRRVSFLRAPQDSLEFIKNYSINFEEPTEVIFQGPSSYITHFVEQANELDYVTAYDFNLMED